MDESRLTTLAADALRSDSDYVGVRLEEGTAPSAPLVDVALEGSLLVRVRGAGGRWSHLRLSDVVLRDCDWANAIWEKAHGVRVVCSRCRLTGWNLSDGVLRHARFVGCKLDLALFHQATLTDCHFEQCQLVEADFQGARLKNVRFERCDLRGARFAAAALAEVDFRGSHLAGAYLEPNSLRGNIFDPTQLPDLAALLGLVVKEVERDPSLRSG